MSALTLLAFGRLAGAAAALFLSVPALAQAPPAWASARSVGAVTATVGGAAVDAAGNTYEAGSFPAPAIVIDGTMFNSLGGTDAYLAKYTPTGALAWVRQIGSAGTDMGIGVALDDAGNPYVTGLVSGPAALGNNVTLNGTNSRTFVARYSPQGTAQWAKESSSQGSGNGSGIVLDASGTVYVAGVYSRNVAFDAATTASPSNGFAVYLARFSAATGAALGVTTAFHYTPLVGQGSYPWPRLAMAATGGDAYILNTFTEPAVFGPNTLTPRGASDVLVGRFTPAGALVWVQQLGGPAVDFVNSGAVDAAGNLYVAGTFTGPATFGSTTLPGAGDTDGFLARYSAQGTLDWVQALAGPSVDGFNSVTLDATGNPYAAGNFSSGARIGTFEPTNAGNRDILVAAFTPQGQLRWQQQAGGPIVDTPNHLNLLANGDLHLLGRFAATCEFGPLSLTTAAPAETFLARLNSSTLATRAPRPLALGFYPNPAADLVHLPALPAGSRVQLLDARGRVAREAPVSPATTVPVRGLAPGLYTLRATDARGRQYSGKLVVE